MDAVQVADVPHLNVLVEQGHGVVEGVDNGHTIPTAAAAAAATHRISLQYVLALSSSLLPGLARL
jgi:hypothetical protein